ncbi:MAG TPA: hypothetical protein VKB78_13905, partial [Pirellulales bacterium]|nr:hypothetical protein [Pirellulales bacterium]
MTSTTPHESFLDRPFARASLREHLRMEEFREDREEPFHAAVREFLGVDDAEMADQRSTHPPYDVPQINFALEQCLADWRLVKQGGDWHSYRRPWTPITYRVEIAPGEFRNVVREGTWFYETPAGRRRVISLERFSDERDYDRTVLFPKCDAAIAREELAPLFTWIDVKHYLKGQTLRAGGKLLEKSRDASW